MTEAPGTAYAEANGVDLRIEGPDELYPSAYRVTEAAAQSVGAATASVAAFDRLRTGREQTATVDRVHAAVAFRSERLLRIDGETPPSPWGPIAGTYRTADDGWVQIHANFPHHESGALAVLGLDEPDRAAVGAAVATWSAQELEDALAEAGMVASRQRTTDEWLGHPQGRASAGLPLLDVEQIGPGEAEVPVPTTDRPLAGVRVLDLTRVIAGPVAGRFLAAHGAEVLKVDADHLPQIGPLLVDTGPGKRSCLLDLRAGADRARFVELVRGADVVVDGYRPGALATLGLSDDDLVAHRPGLVVVDLSAYGPVGPWAGRRGFDSLVQTATGITATGQRVVGADRPTPLPCQALDHATGYLAAFGAVDALRRRATQGGSWRVRVSLARTRHWLERLGVVDRTGLPEEVGAEVARLVEPAMRGRRRVPGPLRRRVRIPVDLGDGPERWPLGWFLDVCLTRDAWLHRIDLAEAVGREPELTAEHDGRIVADVAEEWLRRHGQPVTLVLTGPAGGRFTAGHGGEVIELDAVEFCRIVSGRAEGTGLLATAVPF